MRARSLRPLVKTPTFGMTPPRRKFKLSHYRSVKVIPLSTRLFSRHILGHDDIRVTQNASCGGSENTFPEVLSTGRSG